MSGIETKTAADGTVNWLKDDVLHRTSGPAVIHPDGTLEWWQEGLYHREGGPAVEFLDGTRLWLQRGDYHREGGPAVEKPDGSRFWYLHGKLHRADGPAVIREDGTEEWWLDDKHLGAGEIKSLQRQFRQQRDAVLAPFRGTVHAVVAPEKAAFKKHAHKNPAGLRL